MCLLQKGWVRMWRSRLVLVSLSALLLGVSLQPILSRPALAQADSGSVIVSTSPDGQAGERLKEKFKASWPWYLTRASGLVAAVCLIVLMLGGIGQITGHTFRLLDPLTAWASHRALGITLAIAVLLHVVALLFDKFVSFNIIDLLVPWLSSHRPVDIFGFHFGSLYVALGVIALYLILAVTITSLVWIEKKPARWKLIHLLSYFAVGMVFVHALFLGTDVSTGIFKLVWIGINSVVLVAVLARLWRAYTI